MNNIISKKIIGGLFGLQNPINSGYTSLPFENHLKDALYLVNGRSCINFLVKHLTPSTVWMPSYLCKSMIDCLETFNVQIRFYHVDSCLNLSDSTWLNEVQYGDIVCVIDYFGFHCPINIKQEVRSTGAKVLEDACQALLSKNIGEQADYLLFSPLKFLGVPDGGILLSLNNDSFADVHLNEAPAQWWLKAFGASLLRREFDQEENGDSHRQWFELFREANANAPIGDFSMSSISKALLFNAFDYRKISRIRRTNYQVLYNQLNSIALMPELGVDVVPLGFVIRLRNREERERLRQKLFCKNIYPPVHWKILGVVPEQFTESHQLSETIMTLPCDQRYSEDDMKFIANLICEELKL